MGESWLQISALFHPTDDPRPEPLSLASLTLRTARPGLHNVAFEGRCQHPRH